MKKGISKIYINYIIISIIVILIISYCKIMLKEYLMLSEYEIQNTDSIVRLKKDFKKKSDIVTNEDGYESQLGDPLVEVKIEKRIVNHSFLSRRDISIKKIIDGAYKNLGRPYIYGDIGVRGFDCSGLTYSLYLNNLGIKLPRSSSSLVSAGTKVNKGDLKPGDIILFNTSGKGISHVGVYVGEGNMIHASSGKQKVVIEDINSKYYKARYVTARRILQ